MREGKIEISDRNLERIEAFRRLVHREWGKAGNSHVANDVEGMKRICNNFDWFAEAVTGWLNS